MLTLRAAEEAAAGERTRRLHERLGPPGSADYGQTASIKSPAAAKDGRYAMALIPEDRKTEG